MAAAEGHRGLPQPPSRQARATVAIRRAFVFLPGALALLVWRVSLSHVDVSHLDGYGLPPALPAGWYGALLASVGAAVAVILHGRARTPVMLAYVALVAVMLYGTVPVLSAQPHYAWVYKHIGVVRYLLAHGHANPHVDIYNRWPGFFALAAVFSRLAGKADPETYAAWAELAFALLDVVLVVAIVRAVARDVRVAAGAALLFLLTNWVGQTYYSPQAFTYVLALGLILIVLTQLRAPGPQCPRRLARMLEVVARTPQLAVLAREDQPRWPKPAAIIAVLGLDAVIVASHQLTPYMLLASVALLMLAGIARPWWVLAAMALTSFAYFGANLAYIQHNFGLFTSIDPFNNVQVAAYTQTPAPGKVLNTDAELLASAALGVGGAIGALRLLRRGLLVRALPLLLMAVSPFAVIFGQSYGGEASLRIILFSSPWWSALMFWALTTITRSRLRLALAVTGACLFTALFVESFFGQEELNILSPAEVRASAQFYEHARRGSVLVLAAPGFPFKYGGSYPDFRGPEGDAYPNLLSAHVFQNRQLGAGDIPYVIGRIRQYSNYGYVAFTRDETAFAEVLRITPPGALAGLEAAVSRSNEFRLWYANRDAQIYELIAPRVPTAARRGLVPPGLPGLIGRAEAVARGAAAALEKRERRGAHRRPHPRPGARAQPRAHSLSTRPLASARTTRRTAMPSRRAEA